MKKLILLQVLLISIVSNAYALGISERDFRVDWPGEASAQIHFTLDPTNTSRYAHLPFFQCPSGTVNGRARPAFRADLFYTLTGEYILKPKVGRDCVRKNVDQFKRIILNFCQFKSDQFCK